MELGAQSFSQLGARAKMPFLAKWHPGVKQWSPRAPNLLSWSPGALHLLARSPGALNPFGTLKSLSDGSHGSQVHGLVYSFIKSVSPSNPHTIKVVASSVLQCGHVVLSAIHWCTHGSHPKILLQHWAMHTRGLHMSLQIVQVRFEVTCSLNFASSLLCWSPILLLISTQRSETLATFLSTASRLSISTRTEGK